MLAMESFQLFLFMGDFGYARPGNKSGSGSLWGWKALRSMILCQQISFVVSLPDMMIDRSLFYSVYPNRRTRVVWSGLMAIR
jgi:hypothetical protein